MARPVRPSGWRRDPAGTDTDEGMLEALGFLPGAPGPHDRPGGPAAPATDDAGAAPNAGRPGSAEGVPAAHDPFRRPEQLTLPARPTGYTLPPRRCCARFGAQGPDQGQRRDGCLAV